MKSEHNNRKGGTDTYIVHGVGAIMRAQARPNPLARIFLYHLYLPEGGHSLARSSQMDLPKGMSISGH